MADESNPPELLDEDLPCEGCGYNLRGLTERCVCPECGLLNDARMLRTAAGTFRPFDDAVERSSRPPATVAFVHQAVHYTLKRAAFARNRQGTHVTAEDVVWGLRGYALERYGDPETARREVKRLGLTRGEDLGEIISALVEAKMLAASDDDDVAKFNGLFTLDTLFVNRR